MNNRPVVITILFIFSIVFLWWICPAVVLHKTSDGHSLSAGSDGSDAANLEVTPPAESASNEPHVEQPPFILSSKIEKTANLDLSIHTLEIDPQSKDVELRPVLSHESLFGYALLSDMDKKWDALASVNGGFSHPTGLFGGLFYSHGELMTFATGQYPVLFYGSGKANLRNVSGEVWLEGSYAETGNIADKSQESSGSEHESSRTKKAGTEQAKSEQSGADQSQNEQAHSNEDKLIKISSLYYNEYPDQPGLYVLTPSYGSQDRVDSRHLNAVVENGEVRGLIDYQGTYDIPKDGFLITAIGPYAEKRLRDAVKPGMHLEIKYKIEPEGEPISDYQWAYECGSWIIKDGKIIVPEKDNWVGTLETRTPRTAVGIKKDGTVVFIVVDGRQKGLSDGLTGRELAEMLLSMDVRDAAFLDGGASSEMIVGGRIINSPAAGKERMLASGFVLIKK